MSIGVGNLLVGYLVRSFLVFVFIVTDANSLADPRTFNHTPTEQLAVP